MLKDMIIALLAAVILSDAPWWAFEGVVDKTAAILGLSMILFYFLLVWEVKWAKYRIYRERVRKMQKRVAQIRQIRLRSEQRK